MNTRASALVLLLIFVAVAPARAALFDDEEARKRIEATNQRLAQLQRQLEDRIAALETQLKAQGLIELFDQVELVKADAARVRGQFEVLQHELDETQKRQRDLYVDVDSRLRKLEAAIASAGSATPPSNGSPGMPAGVQPSAIASAGPGTPPGAAPGLGTTPRAPDPAAEQRAYDAALDLFKVGNYGGAIGAFASFVKTYPASPLAPSAQYWIGNAHFAQRDFRASIAAQRQLIAAYPSSSKVPDALLNIGTSQFELGETAAARRTMEEIVAKYPQSDAAGKARQRLAGR
jgi:tol-pal system protein YbgF